MKKLFFILIPILFSISVFSQNGVYELRVINDTKCTQYFVVLGGDECKCMEARRSCHSDLISIPANTTIILKGSGVGGVNAQSRFRDEDYIFGVRIAEGPMDMGCFAGGTVGQPNCGAIETTHLYEAKIQNCVLCPDNPKTIATWKPALCNEIAILTFTNP